MKKSKTYKFNPDWAVHPKEILSEHMACLGLSQSDMELKYGISASDLNEVLSGRSVIKEKLALQLGKVFEIPWYFWVNLSRIYRKRIKKLRKRGLLSQ